MDLNPYKPESPPLSEAPDGYLWYGVYPNMKLITREEYHQMIHESLGALVQNQKGCDDG